ncbi:AraC family transcriptional regulator [Chitinivorax sp. B]|uniref:helix-turn-helix transcriptional regulator n=1 Tax=Chitinivorax sp. B TaxID=2502235 RepID=UPI0010F56CA2|nr:AraC family transcriptional regulator [Chitinivorax sp. B]
MIHATSTQSPVQVTPNVGVFCRIRATHRHAIRRVPINQPTLIRVVRGNKQVWWGQVDRQIGIDTMLVLPVGAEVHLANVPDVTGCYEAEMWSLDAMLLARMQRHHAEVVASSLSLDRVSLPWQMLDPVTERAWTRLWSSITTSELALPIIQHRAEECLLSLLLAGGGQALFVANNGGVVDRVRQWVMLLPAHPWTTAELAARMNCSEATLRRKLAHFGASVRDILENVRMGQGLALLQTSSHDVAEIAAQCGYQSASRFSIRFRERYGLSPSELRRAMA